MHLLHVAQKEMEAFLSFRAHTNTTSPRHFLMLGRLLARQHTYTYMRDGYRLRKFFDISTVPHGSEWLRCLCVFACILWTYFALASRLHVISMGFEAFAHGHYYNSFFFLSCAFRSLVHVIDFFICSGCDPVEGHLLFNFAI